MHAPIRARKARYYEDAQFKERVLSPPDPQKSGRTSRADGWSALTPQKPDAVLLAEMETAESDQANSGLRREPELPDHVAIAKETTDQKPAEEFAMMLDDAAGRCRPPASGVAPADAWARAPGLARPQ